MTNTVNTQPADGNPLPDAFAFLHLPMMKVLGDCMVSEVWPSFPPETILYVDAGQAEYCQPGDKVIARLNRGETVFRVLAVEDGKTYLKPLNPSYPIIDEPFAITGKVVGVCTRY